MRRAGRRPSSNASVPLRRVRAGEVRCEEFLYELKAGPAGGRLRRPPSAGSARVLSLATSPQTLPYLTPCRLPVGRLGGITWIDPPQSTVLPSIHVGRLLASQGNVTGLDHDCHGWVDLIHRAAPSALEPEPLRRRWECPRLVR
jgi:hypothetical protein